MRHGHYRTRYEITATHPDGRAWLVGYTARPSRHGLLNLMRQHAGKLIQILGIGEQDQMTFGTKPRAHATVSGWTVGLTGRTQREAKQGGELPWIAA